MLGIPMAAVVTALLLLSQLHGVANEEKGSTEGPLLPQYKVLLRHSGRDTAEWFNRSSSAALRAAHLAATHINNASSLSITVQLVEIFDGEIGPPDDSVVAIASAECTNETCHAYSQSHGLPVVSFSPSCLSTVNSTQYESSTPDQEGVLCMLPSLSHLPAGIAALITHYKWQRVSIISQTEETIAASTDDIYSALQGVYVNDVRQSTIPTASHELPSDLLDRDYRIVILNLTPSSSRRVLCEAVLRENLSRHVWIVPGWYPDTWWEQREGGEKEDVESQSQSMPGYSCSDWELKMLVKEGKLHVLSLLQSPLPANYSKSNGNICEEYAMDDDNDMYGDMAYDAMWAIGRALTMYESTGDLYSLLVNSDFTGVSGQVVFDDNTGHRVLGYYSLSQLRYTHGQLKHTPVAKITNDTSGMLKLDYVSGESELSVWPDGVPPDGTPLEKMKHPLLYLVIVYFILSGVVILWAVVCCVFNILFREKKLIKLTSPTLNIMIAIGVILMNLSTPLVMYPEAFESGLAAICIIRSYLLPLGWSLSLCTITVKMWRVFIIYRTTSKLQSLKHKRMRKFLQDKYMVALVICMAIVDIIIITTGVSIPVSRFVPERVPDQEFPPYRNNDDIQVMFYNYQCSSEKGLIWVTILFGYKILFIMSGTVLAFLTRKVKVRGLNESREVQLVMIMITPIAVGSLILRLALRDYLNVVGSVYALSASLSGGIMLCIIFIPKMIYLCMNPSGDKIYISKYNTEMPTSSIGRRSERSLTKTSLISFDPSSSLKSLLRRAPSLDSGMGSSSGPGAEEVGIFERGKTTTLSRHVLFALPTIEEGDCSNDITTTDYSDGAFEANPFIGTQEDESEQYRVGGHSPSDCIENFNFTEESVDGSSPTQPIILSHLTQFQRSTLRHSWHDTPHHHITSVETSGGHHPSAINGRFVPSKMDSFGLTTLSTKLDRTRLASFGSLPSLDHLECSSSFQPPNDNQQTTHHTTDNQQTTHHTTDNQQTTHHTTDNQQTTHHTTDNQQATHQTTGLKQATHDTTDNHQATHHTTDLKQATHDTTDNHQATHPHAVFQSMFDSSGITLPRTECTVEDTSLPSITFLSNYHHIGSRDNERGGQEGGEGGSERREEEKRARERGEERQGEGEKGGERGEEKGDNKISLELQSILINPPSPSPVALECNA